MTSIDEDLVSMKTFQIPSMGDTNTVYSEIYPGDDSMLDNEMPDALSYFTGRIDPPLESKASPTKLSDNSLRTTIIIAGDDSFDSQDKAEDLIVETQPAGDNFKSNFFYS
jgi:hypothetical protein